MTIRAIYLTEEPTFPATDQHPDAVRYVIGGKWVDATGGEPTEAEVDAIVSPNVSLTDQAALNAALAAEGSVFRGFVLVMLDEINLLRAAVQVLNTKTTTTPALAQRTIAQIKPAITAKMR